MYKIQYSHDGIKWFNYGFDAKHRGAQLFQSIEEAEQCYERFTRVPTFSFARIVDDEGGEVKREDKCQHAHPAMEVE